MFDDLRRLRQIEERRDDRDAVVSGLSSLIVFPVVAMILILMGVLPQDGDYIVYAFILAVFFLVSVIINAIRNAVRRARER